MFHSSYLLYTNQSLVAPSVMGKAYPGSLQHNFPLWAFTDSLIVFIQGFEPEVMLLQYISETRIWILQANRFTLNLN